ncbi:MAG: DHH family phosphoesterase [Deltaproteobacteria bacterium]|nr:DHH family phosphoesterase [Deltaproteobacteria bacterium]
MGQRFRHWESRSDITPKTLTELQDILQGNRQFTPVLQLHYGDHGLQDAFYAMKTAIQEQRKIALYADYDVDGTMSCVSWIWFFESIGFHNYTYYIPDRFREGYGVNLEAVQYLVRERQAELILTMDTGITANVEATWCRENGVTFICTDHHKIQPDKMPDCLILNPRTHPDPDYQELCGCGITFVLLRKLGEVFQVSPDVWNDILALTGMATICDVVPLNGVNHRLVQYGVQALLRSERPVLRRLLQAASAGDQQLNEQDVGFRLGPRINAVGRLGHASQVVRAFIHENPDPLIQHMSLCNEQRKSIQADIVREARELAHACQDDPVLFLGGDWHQGVVGIAASKIAEEFWKPVWLFSRQEKICRGSARSLPGFDVTEAMGAAASFFDKFGGHKAAGGFSFIPDHEDSIRQELIRFAGDIRQRQPDLWESRIAFDCHLPSEFLNLRLSGFLDQLRPFGHGFEEPLFLLRSKIQSVQFYRDKKTGEERHTAVHVCTGDKIHKIMFFNDVHRSLEAGQAAEFLVTAGKNYWNGQMSLSLMGRDFRLFH